MTTDIAALDLAKLKEAAAGFHGEFAFEPEHDEDRGIGNCADCVSFDDALVYVPAGCVLGDDECFRLSEGIEQHIAEPLAEMLNAVPELIAEIEKLRDLVASYREDQDAFIGKCERLSSTITTLTAEVERLKALWDSDPTAAAFRARDEAITEGRRAVARAEKAETKLLAERELAAQIVKANAENVRNDTAERIAAWLGSDCGNPKYAADFAADIRAGAWRAKEPV
jgi:hypothetical protein